MKVHGDNGHVTMIMECHGGDYCEVLGGMMALCGSSNVRVLVLRCWNRLCEW